MADTEYIKKFDLVGKYAKLFKAKRGKYATARTTALFELDQTIPTFKTWRFYNGFDQLHMTFTAPISYAVEDDIFDVFEKHYDNAGK